MDFGYSWLEFSASLAQNSAIFATFFKFLDPFALEFGYFLLVTLALITSCQQKVTATVPVSFSLGSHICSLLSVEKVQKILLSLLFFCEASSPQILLC